MKIFTNKAALVAATLTAGQLVETKGYTAAGDGGAGRYLVKTAAQAVTDGDTIDEIGAGFTLTNGNVVVLQVSPVTTVEQFGARCDGTTENAPAWVAMHSALGYIKLPKGKTSLVDDMSFSTDVEIYANGATILRSPDAENNWLFFTSPRLRMVGGVYDLNTANTTNSHGISVNTGCIDSELLGIEVKNSTLLTGFGSGIYYDTGVSDAQKHKVSGCILHDNDESGLNVQSCNHLTVSLNKVYSNGSAGIVFNNFDQTFVKKILNSSVLNNECYSNGGSGITIGNFIADNDISTGVRLYGHANAETVSILVEGNQCNANSGYGISASGDYITVVGNTARDNGDGGSVYGGMLFNARYSLCASNTIMSNDSYGIDAGGAANSIITDNNIQFNGTGVGAPGITLEGCVQVDCTNNYLLGNSASGHQINVLVIGGDGTGNYFPNSTDQVTISDNRIICDSARRGISASNNPTNLVIINNKFSGATTNDQYMRLLCANPTVEGNQFPQAVSRTLTPDGTGALVVPDGFDYAYTTSTTTIEGILSSSCDYVGRFDAIGYLTRTSGGSGYTSAPTVVFTGGGGTGAAATAYLFGGVVIAVQMTNYGTGYTSAPTISFTGGGGTGAAYTAVRGVPPSTGNQFTLHCNSAVTVRRNGTQGPVLESPTAADLSVPANGAFSVMGRFSRWGLISKNY